MTVFARARRDPRWQDAQERYLSKDYPNADTQLIARLAAINEMYAIEREYEIAALASVFREAA